VTATSPTSVTVGGTTIAASAVVVATEGPAASALLDGIRPVESKSVGAVYFAAPAAPVDDKLVVLDGTGRGPVLNVAVMSNVAPTYAPAGSHLVVAALPGHDGPTIEADARAQLRGWWGPQVDAWDHLATYRIAHGQPRQRPPFQPKQRVFSSTTDVSCAAITATPPRSRVRCSPVAGAHWPSPPRSVRLARMADGTTNDDANDDKVVRGIRFVPADPQAIFDLLADPSQHPTIDGSGSVRASAVDAPQRLTLGSKFAMSMKMGLPYKITNEVVEFDEPSLIAWQHMGKHIWRYRLAPVDGGTEVTEEFDFRPARSATALKLSGVPKRNAKAIEATLDRLAAHFQPTDA
jgi:hypothetical protein